MWGFLGLFLATAMWVNRPAQAVTGLEWQWGEQGRTYLIVAEVQSPEFLWFKAEKNLEARVSAWRTNILTSCTPVATAKKSWELRCVIDDISMQAKSLPSDRGRLDRILAEYKSLLIGSYIQLDFTRDGRVRNVDLEGIDKRNRRVMEIIEVLRLVLGRAYAALDLQLPKRGDDRDLGVWRQVSPLAAGFPTNVGSLGSLRVNHQVTAQEGSVVLFQSAAEGVTGSGRMIEVGGQEQVANMFRMTMAGVGSFDTKSGALVSRQYQVHGVPTASAELGDGWQGINYVQSVRLDLMSAESPTPNLGETREWGHEVPETESAKESTSVEEAPTPK